MVIASLRVSKTVSFHSQTHNESEDWAHLPALIEKYITKEKVDIRRLRHVLHSDHGIVLKPHELSRLIKCYGISVPRGKRNVYHDCLAPPPSGPNDEWGIMAVTDVHPALGLVVFGIRDKFSQRQLALRVVPIEHSRDKRVPLALFLKSVKELGGIPHILLSDERTPSQLIASVQINLRKQYESVDDSNRASVLSSIKKARSSEIYWAKTFYQLFGQELADIGAWYLDYASQKAAGYDRFNPTHRAIARWLWAKITQHTLNKWCERNNHGVISNGTPDEAYRNPQKYDGEDILVKLPAEEIMTYWSEETVAELFQFGSDAEVDLARTLYERVRPLEPRPALGWSTFQAMLSLYDTGRVVVISAKPSLAHRKVDG